MDKAQYILLIKQLSEYLNPERLQLINQILSHRTRHFTVVVEDVYQQHNAGAIVRTCECMGIQDVHIIETRNNFKASEGISRGALKWIDAHFYNHQQDESQHCLKQLKAKGYQIVATMPHIHSHSIDDFDVSKKSAFILGAEKKGVSASIIAQADVFLHIPMFGFTESYNVSVACALVLHSLTKRLRQQAPHTWQLGELEYLEKKLEWIGKSLPNGEKMIQHFLKMNQHQKK